MKKILQTGLGTTLLVAFGLLFNMHVSSCNNGGGGPTDSTGNQTTAKDIVISSPVSLPPGTPIRFECADDKCNAALPNTDKPDAAAGQGNAKVIAEFTLPVEIPANTKFRINIGPKGSPVALRIERVEK